MFHQLVNHNADIKKLVDKGYAVAFDGLNYLVVRDVPYLDQVRSLQWGAIVSKFVDKGKDVIEQEDHQILFAGSHPHGLDGKPIPNLGGGPVNLTMSDGSKDVGVQRSFSNKPTVTGKFNDFFEKVESYVTIISGPAIELHNANPLTFRTVESGPFDSPFKFRDTLTSRAEIGDLSAKFKNDVIAIIGLGGTGAYILDFMVKTPVREIRGFDKDRYFVHNAFRSPGKLDESEVGKAKAEIYHARYDNFRTGLTIAEKFVDATCEEDFKGVTFAFVCVDKGSSRAGIFDLLMKLGIPFIDVGMGLNRKQGMLDGMLRVTYYSAERAGELRAKGLSPLTDEPNDEYRTNIQISELNALNACLAVLRFKQIRGFYFEELIHNHLLFGVGDLKIAGDAETEQN
jgi:ThiF family